MKKKTIVALAFCVLILATIILTAVFAAETYRAEKNSPTIKNILEGLGAVVVAIFGSIIVFYECDLFYTVYYLLCGLKRKAKTVLVILANLTWLLSFAYFYLANNVYMELRKYVFTPLVLFAVYIVLKIAALFFRPKDPNDASL